MYVSLEGCIKMLSQYCFDWIQLEDLQQAYVRMEQQSARREDNLKREIADLRKVNKIALYNWYNKNS